MSIDNIVKYGYFPVPRDPEVLLKGHATAGDNPQQASYTLAEVPFPDSELIRKSKAFVERELSKPTFNHSHRVYIYGKCF
jgi:cyanamide hydratase